MLRSLLQRRTFVLVLRAGYSYYLHVNVTGSLCTVLPVNKCSLIYPPFHYLQKTGAAAVTSATLQHCNNHQQQLATQQRKPDTLNCGDSRGYNLNKLPGGCGRIAGGQDLAGGRRMPAKGRNIATSANSGTRNQSWRSNRSNTLKATHVNVKVESEVEAVEEGQERTWAGQELRL